MPSLPLQGVRILDLSQVWAGPLASRLLADMGAEVIRVEACQRIDIARTSDLAENEPGERPWERGHGSMHHRNKYGITLNLSHPHGVDIFKRLVRISDVVLENFSPRVMENFGLTYAVLREIKPDIIMLSMSAYGQTGPYRNYIGFGTSIEAVAGLCELAGYPDGPPTEVGSNLSDPPAGFYGAGAILVALHYRHKTGKGQYIDLSEAETAITLIGGQILDYTMNGRVQSRIGNRHPWMAPHGVYPSRGDDQWVAIAVRSEEEWQSFCKAIGSPAWTADKRFADMLSRWQNQEELDRHIEDWTSNLDHYEVMHLLQEAGVPAAAVLTNKEVLFDQHVRERKAFEAVDHPETGRRPMPAMTFRMSKTPGSIRKPAPLLGENNEYILRELLGITEAEIAQLAAEQVIGNQPIPIRKPEIVPISRLQSWNVLAGVDTDYLEQLHKLYQ